MTAETMTAERKNLSQPALQWSRGLLTAETQLHGELHGRRQLQLQWSRGLLTAETTRAGAWCSCSQELQWSRGLLTAETMLTCFGFGK